MFRELEYCYNGTVWAIVCDPNIVLDISEWSIRGGGQLERFDCTVNPNGPPPHFDHLYISIALFGSQIITLNDNLTP